MKWHNALEMPKPDVEVLADVAGFAFAKYVVLKWDKDGFWWQHIPRLADAMTFDAWIACPELLVIRWAYIEEED